jgi:hypothetical protein
VIEGDGQLKGSSVATLAAPDHTIRTIILICTGLVTTAFFLIILIFWRRRRKEAQTAAMQLPPRRW